MQWSFVVSLICVEILESCWLGVRGMQKRLAPQASKPIESVVISFHTTMQMQ